MQRAAASIACSALRRLAATASVAARPAIVTLSGGAAAGQVACGRAGLSLSQLRLLAPIWDFSRSYARGRREAMSSDDDEEAFDDDDDKDDEDFDDEAEPLDDSDVIDTWGDLDGEDDAGDDESE